MSDEEYFTNYDSDKNSDAENESQDNQNSILQSSRKKIKHTIEVGNRLVKDNHKFRERWPLGRFVHKSRYCSSLV